MTMKVTISVIGSAILYLKNGAWNVVFITDDCHEVKFEDPKGETILAKPDMSRTIDFSAAGSTPPVPPSPLVVNEFLNMSSESLHGVRSPGLSNLDVRPKPNDGRQYIYMTIPYGVVSVIKHTGGECFIEPYRSGLPETLGRDVASEFSISFDVAGTDELTMTIRDKSGDDVRKYSSTPALDLRFDNYCNAVQPYNDFINFYDWLYDTTSADPAEPKRFVAGKLIRINLLPPGPALAGRIMGRQGDCEPIIIDPPPGP